MTKLLRILTGVHAGADLRLSVGVHRIGADDDADIHISDWSGGDVSLVVDSGGVVSACRLHPFAAAADGVAAMNESSHSAQGVTLASQTDDEPGTVILLDFVPMQFGEIVICIGLDDAAWPSDLELLSTLLVKPDETQGAAERSRRRRTTYIVSACAMLGAVLVIGLVMLTTVFSHAALPRSAVDLAQRVNRELAAHNMKEVHAEVHGSTVTVSGMVATADEDTQLRKMLMRISPDRIVRHYDVAQRDVSSMADSIAMQGLRVVYTGRGTFEISGSVVNPHDVESAVARIRHDLSDNVKDVRLRVAQAEDALTPAPPFSFLMSSDDIRYGQTPDGVKHIYTLQENAPAVAARNGPADGNAKGKPSATGSVDEVPAAARGVVQTVEDIPASQRAANSTAYLSLPK
ncbi:MULTISPECIES: secretion protein [unclassified Cupriavidus]|uniref:secretion protein n=1 Tax=unclassified Cupriavidus TaxID=2640874 RepID=UPI001AE97D11|nr:MULTISPECIES: secretion protein [unclassified Cupriavidus]MBP0633417.1 secretion protein [Cupriavidus sp. AcVe19-1a]MBP0640071.1 secretion protein [Cupriavidus sp. AcVe19-6a]